MIFKYGHVIASIVKRYLATRCHSRVIHFVEKQSIAVLSLVILFACTDYEAQIDDEYEEWIAEQGENSSESSSSSNKVSEPDEEDAESSSSEKVESSSSTGSEFVDGVLIDYRDGQRYKTTVIASQTWMAENLNYETDDTYCYNDDANNCAKYGRLYRWAATTTACPSGWHLPSNDEWNILFDAVGGQSTAGKALKSQTGWRDSGLNDITFTDDFGFSALPAGYENGWGYYSEEFSETYFWSSDIGNCVSMHLKNLDDRAILECDDKTKSESAEDAISVRCLKD